MNPTTKNLPGLVLANRLGTRITIYELPPEESIVIYGAGSRGIDLFKYLAEERPDINIVCFCDSYKQGEQLGKKINTSDFLQTEEAKGVLVIIASHWSEDIVRRLDELGITNFHTAILQHHYSHQVTEFHSYPGPNSPFVRSISYSENKAVLSFFLPNGWEIRSNSNIDGINIYSDTLTVDINAFLEEPTLHFDLHSSGADDSIHSFTLGLFQRPLLQFIRFYSTDLIYQPTATTKTWSTSFRVEETDYIINKYGAALKGCEGDLEKAHALARALLSDIIDARGSWTYGKKRPIEMLRGALAGEYTLECGPISDIYEALCHAFGIQCRTLGIGHHFESGDMSIVVGDRHKINEVYVNELQQWVFVDLTLYALGAKICDNLWLSWAELHHFMTTAREAFVGFELFLPKEDMDFDISILRDYYRNINQRVSYPHAK